MERIIIYLNGDRGVAVLKEILDCGHEVLSAVVPNNKIHIIEQCKKFGAQVIPADDINSEKFLSYWSGNNKPKLGIIAGFPTIFSQKLIELPELGTINLHAGRLPQYRGGSPLNWQIINGEKKAFISIVSVDGGIDTGDVLTDACFDIGDDDTIADLHSQVNQIFPKLVKKVISQIEENKLETRKQDESSAQYWHQRNDRDGHINWAYSTAYEVHNLVRAITHPYPGALAFWEGNEVRIFRTKIVKNIIKGVPGRVIWIQGRGPYVVCADRALLVKEYVVNLNSNLNLTSGIHLV